MTCWQCHQTPIIQCIIIHETNHCNSQTSLLDYSSPIIWSVPLYSLFYFKLCFFLFRYSIVNLLFCLSLNFVFVLLTVESLAWKRVILNDNENVANQCSI